MKTRMEELLYAEINISCCALMILLLIRIVFSFRRDERTRAYIRALCGFILFLVFDTVWGVVHVADIRTGFRFEMFFESIYLLLTQITAMNLFFFLSCNIKGREKKRMREIIPGMLPAVAGILILMLNRFHTGCVFRVVGKGEELEIGFWYYIVWIPVYIYLLAASVLVLRHLRRDGRLADREEDVLALICLAVLWIGAILDECFLFVPAISMALTICFLVAYLNEQSSIVYMDALTHLNNRRQFNRYLDAKIRERKSSDKNVFLAIVDIDFFKEINDKYGHVEGDSALVHTADCLRACAEEEDGKMLICRYGGDEFALVMEAADHSQVENFCIKVQKMLSETGKNKAYALEISFGIAPLTEDCSGINELLRSADEAMYALKQLHHSRRA